MAIDRMGEVAEFLTSFENGQTHDATPVIGNDVALRGQDIVAASKINELVDASNANETAISDETDRATGAEEALGDRVTVLEGVYGGDFPDGVTAGETDQISVGVIDGYITGVDRIDHLTINDDNELGPQDLPDDWAGAKEDEIVTVAAVQHSYGHQINTTATLSGSGAVVLPEANYRHKTIIIPAATSITNITLPDVNTVPDGVRWRFLNLRSGTGSLVTLSNGVELSTNEWVTVEKLLNAYYCLENGSVVTS